MSLVHESVTEEEIAKIIYVDEIDKITKKSENVGRIDLEKFLMRMFSSTLRRYACHCTFQDL